MQLVKSEPAEKNITPPPLFHGGNEQTREGVETLGDTFAAFERDSQQWMPRLQNNPEMGSTEFLSSSEQNMPSFPGMAQLLSPPAEASCSTFSFPGKPYGELKNSMISQTPFGSSDPLMISHEGGLHGMTETLMNHSHKRKRAFWCTVCGKSFQCSSHLSIHHRTHTGEKPYGCGQCGKRFTQQSSLRVHQRTHSGERPYSCSQCGKTFILMHHLNISKTFGVFPLKTKRLKPQI
uniref:C2H2-type domain-containing protein n=1 Tax=Neolamprologus brichardi TaxID=32507 RepID=A0A3Q4HEP6_NEOBR